MESTCRRCQDEFTVTGEDLDFYAQLSPVFDGRRFELPPPSFCPDCRHQQRLAFRNERRLFRRPCSATGRQIISIFPENSPYKVLANEVWWGSSWDARDFGRSYDFSRPFFEQFRELHRDIPKQALIATNNENSDYVNYALNCRDCYLLLGWGENNEHCMYGRLVVGCRDCIDISNARDCELCCHSTDISTCYRLFYSQSCKQCSDSWYLKNCLACSDCFGCINLSHRRYCIFNEQYSREDYDLRL
ncbi:MAG TPA: hypothetical protein PLP17_16675, partial [Oligoflexia bacterium]|nr:hypothetical protein [Oligoflexia bacterium]